VRRVRLKHVARLVGGGTPAVDKDAYWAHGDEGTRWVTFSDLSYQRAVTGTSRRLSDDGLAAARLTPAPVGTVLFSIYASVGLVSELALPAVWNQAILGVIPSEGVLGRYLAYALEALRPSLSLHMRSNTQNNLNADTVRNLALAIPSFDRQSRIADYLDAETARLVELGAAVVHEKQEWGAQWRTLTDPEGNEFCVVATAAGDPAESAQHPAPA